MDIQNIKIVYINLEHRKDRREHIEKQFEKLNISKENITRINAAYYPKNGALGCCVSHIQAIEMAIREKWNKVLILEDDFKFDHNLVITNSLLTMFCELKMDWDVLMFGCNLIDHTPINDFLNKVIQGKTTSGYLLNRHYYQTLLDNFRGCFTGLNTEIYVKQKQKTYCVDMGWRCLQPTGNWYVTNPKLGSQKDGYSDIMKQYKKYDC